MKHPWSSSGTKRGAPPGRATHVAASPSRKTAISGSRRPRACRRQSAVPVGQALQDPRRRVRKKRPFDSMLRLQQQRRQRRGERERVEGGERDREGDGERELLVEASRGSREEGDRNEHGDEHQRGRDHRAGHLAHRLRGRGVRRRCALSHVALDVLDDDDGVVHHQAGGQRDAEERQGVDGEAEELDEAEGADQRDRDGDRGDQRAAPVLQEEEDDEDDEDDRLRPGSGALPGSTRRRRSWCRRRGWYFSPGGKRFDRRSSSARTALSTSSALALRELHDAEAHGLVAVEAQVGAVVLRAQLGAAHVLQTHERAVGRGFTTMSLELAGLA